MPVSLPNSSKTLAAALASALVIAAPVGANERRTLSELMSGWGTQLDNVEVRTETLKPGLHVLRGAGGAVLASLGEDGVLIVDDQFPQVVPQLRRAIVELGGGDVDFVVNTHWHFDHADGNPLLGSAGARIIAHSNSRRKMTRANTVTFVGYHYRQPPYPAAGLPVITFDNSMSLHFNGQRVDVMHFGPAHTTGDAVVFFRGDNVVHMGDLFNARFPYIDAGNGGTLAGLIAVCRSIADQIDEDTRIVSGHAPVVGYADLQDYIAMLETAHARLERLIADGRTLEQTLAAKPMVDFEAKRGADSTLFVTMAYQTLGRP